MATINHLVDSQIKAAKAKNKAYQLNDGGSLSLRVKISGSKSWVFNYHHPFTKKRVSIGLGSYPDRSLSAERALRDKYRTLIIDKVDPVEYERDKLIEEKQKSSILIFLSSSAFIPSYR